MIQPPRRVDLAYASDGSPVTLDARSLRLLRGAWPWMLAFGVVTLLLAAFQGVQAGILASYVVGDSSGVTSRFLLVQSIVGGVGSVAALTTGIAAILAAVRLRRVDEATATRSFATVRTLWIVLLVSAALALLGGIAANTLPMLLA